MDRNTINTVIVLRNDQTTNWTESSVVMLKGEVGIGYLDNGNVIAKLGDGQHSWSELPQIEGVFETDQILTYNFGRHKTVNGKVNAGGKGMTTSQWLLDALSQSLTPKTNYPTASFAAGDVKTDTETFEIGSKIIAFSWNGSHSNGSYVGNDGNGTYGSTGGTTKASGVNDDAFTWNVTNSIDSSEGHSEDGTFSLSSDDYIKIDSTTSKTYATLSATVDIDASSAYVPYNNLGQEYLSGKITGFDNNGTTSKSFKDISVTASGYWNSWQYVGDDCTTTIDSSFIRGTIPKGDTVDFGTVDIAAGTKRVMFAVPGKKKLSSIIDVDGMGLDVKDNFNTMKVDVEGANGFTATEYTVFVNENSNGMAATRFTVTIVEEVE